MKLKHLVTFGALLIVVNIALDAIGWTHVASWVTMLLIVVAVAVVVWLLARAWRRRPRSGHIDTTRPRTRG